MNYEIEVRGQLDESWTEWFDHVEVVVAIGKSGATTTILIKGVPDSPALFGILNRIRDLNLRLVSLRQVE